MAFCKEYNAATQDKVGTVIPVEITVFEVSSFVSGCALPYAVVPCCLLPALDTTNIILHHGAANVVYCLALLPSSLTICSRCHVRLALYSLCSPCTQPLNVLWSCSFHCIAQVVPLPILGSIYYMSDGNQLFTLQDRSFTFILKTPPASVLLAKAAGVPKGSGNPKTEKVGKISQAQLKVC